MPERQRVHQSRDNIFNLTHDGCFQQELFDTTDRSRPAKVMNIMDRINNQMGSNTLKYMAAGLSVEKPWETAFTSGQLLIQLIRSSC